MPSLQMPLYVSAKDVVDRMQVNDELEGVTDVVNSAIIGAQLQLQTITQSSLEVQSQDCLYFLDPDMFSGLQPGGVFRLELPSSFIRATPTPVITFDSTWDLPQAQTASTGFKIDYKRGYVLMDRTAYVGTYVRIQCQTGFAVNPVPDPGTGSIPAWTSGTSYIPGNPVTLDGSTYVCTVANSDALPASPATDTDQWTLVVNTPEQVPNDVYEAIMSLVGPVFDSSQVTNRSGEQQPQAQKSFDRAKALLLPYMRIIGFSFRPVQ